MMMPKLTDAERDLVQGMEGFLADFIPASRQNRPIRREPSRWSEKTR